jgi:ADP-ribosyl-[dinitrogen reductase] hydrolase
MEHPTEPSDREAAPHTRGVLFGIACGDALGRPVEFETAEAIQEEHGTIRDMLGGGVHDQPAGTVTDDTQQALCIARSLIECGTFDPEDLAARFREWYNTDPFSIGRTTQWALYDLTTGYSWDEAGKRAWEGDNAGNGSVMRCAPLALAYQDDPDTLAEVSKQSSVITHYDPRCVYGCAVLNLTLAAIIDGADAPLRTALDRVEPEAPSELIDALRPVCRSAEPALDPEKLEPTGYVVNTLQTALHDGLSAKSPEEGIIMAVNRGGDADTIGAVTGAIVGARFGESELPDRWVDAIDETTELDQLSRSLWNRIFEASTASAAYDYNSPETTR